MHNIHMLFEACFENDFSPSIAEIWGRELLRHLTNRTVMAPLVNRDFEEGDIQSFGCLVNTRRIGSIKTRRKTGAASDCYHTDDVAMANVQVKLNQFFYSSFTIGDESNAKSIDNLMAEITPLAGMELAAKIDAALLGHIPQFVGNAAGGLNVTDPTKIKCGIIECAEALSDANVPEENRRLIVSNQTKSALLKCNELTKVNESGTTAGLRRGQLGELFGFDVFSANQSPRVSDANTDYVDGTVTPAIAAGSGSGSATAVTLTGYEVQVGDTVVIEGNDQCQWAVAATTGAGNTTDITLNSNVVSDVAAGARIRVYRSVASVADYSAEYPKEIKVDGFTAGKAPQKGQQISFGVGAARETYTIIDVCATDATGTAPSTEAWLQLDRPLVNAVANNQLGFPGPSGSFNFAFHPDAIAFVSRPMAPAGFGATSRVISNGDMALRFTWMYDIKCGATIVNVDMLGGIKVLDTRMGCVFKA